ncbi:MAG: hypothetical protein M1829_001953 [Trizodia sp. TS-e1964]|nr:MAG: hypothetical protein M1829_001953 [Trizodia sp. TS-e1964]
MVRALLSALTLLTLLLARLSSAVEIKNTSPEQIVYITPGNNHRRDVDQDGYVPVEWSSTQIIAHDNKRECSATLQREAYEDFQELYVVRVMSRSGAVRQKVYGLKKGQKWQGHVTGEWMSFL